MLKLNIQFIVIIGFITFFTNQCFSQLVTQCEIVDSTNLIYNGIYSAHPYEHAFNYNIAYRNENNILIYGHQDSVRINSRLVNPLVLTRYTDRAKSKEIVNVPKIATYHNIWTSISSPSDNYILISNDTLEFLGYFNNSAEYKYYSWILISKDNGTTWQKKYLDSNMKSHKLTMIDSNNGFLLLYHKNNYFNKFSTGAYTILKTTNCWETYEKVSLPNDFWGVHYIFDMNKYALRCNDQVKEQEYLRITTDGGSTWNNSTLFPKYFTLVYLKYFDKIAYAMGYQSYETSYTYKIPYHIKSTNNGLNWMNLDYKNSEDINPYITQDIDWLDENNAVTYEMTALYKSRIAQTTDGGNTWFEESRPFLILDYGNGTNDYQLSNIAHPSNDLIIAPIYSKYILKWDDKKTLKAPKFVPLTKVNKFSIENKKMFWDKIDGAEQYRFIVKQDTIGPSTFDNFNIDTIIVDTCFEISNLNYNSQYTTYVKAIGNNMESDWSMIVFRTILNDSCIAPPGLLSPGNGDYLTEGAIKFIWEKVPEAEKYSISVKSYSGNVVNKTAATEDTTIVFENIPAYQLLNISLWSIKTDYQSISYKYNIFVVPSAVSVEEITKPLKQDQILVYPNPVSSDCYIHFDSESLGMAKVSIYNLLGEKVHSKSLQLIHGRNIIPIDISSLANGVYSIVVNDANQVRKGMFVRE